MSEYNEFSVRSDVELLSDSLIEVLDIAEKAGIQCWVGYGALLGLVREDRLLPWNNDVELGCWYEDDINEKLLHVVDELNTKKYHACYYQTCGAISIRRAGVNIVINCFWCDGKYAVRPHESPSQPGYAPFLSQVAYWSAVFMATYPRGLLGGTYRILSINEAIKVVAVGLLSRLPLSWRRKLILLLFGLSERFGGTFKKTGIPIDLLSNFTTHYFNGAFVRIPANPEKILEFIW